MVVRLFLFDSLCIFNEGNNGVLMPFCFFLIMPLIFSFFLKNNGWDGVGLPYNLFFLMVIAAMVIYLCILDGVRKNLKILTRFFMG